MKKVELSSNITLYCGDCLEILPALEPNQFDSNVTDPPYGLQLMQKQWDSQVPCKEFWQETLRTVKPGGNLLCFGGTRTYHRVACAIEDAGWEIRDCLMWLYGCGLPKGLDISKAIDKHLGAERKVIGKSKRHNSRAFGAMAGDPDYGTYAGGVPDLTEPATEEAKLWNGWNTTLKPAWEAIVLATKPIELTFAENAIENGVAGLNIGGCRIGDCQSNKDSSGRWPTNVILDETSASILDQQTGILKSGTGGMKKATAAGYQGSTFGKESRPVGTVNVEYGDSGGASRFFYCTKAPKSEKGKDNSHPTVKPIQLMEYLCKLVSSPKKGIILDQFMGSGTTGVACAKLNIPFVGIEASEEYFEIAVNRIRKVLTENVDLFRE